MPEDGSRCGNLEDNLLADYARKMSTTGTWSGGRGRFSSYEIKGIEEAIEAVREKSDQIRQNEGLSRLSFFFGVMNVPLFCYVTARYPSYLWLLYAGELLFLLPAWFVTVSRVYDGALFALDFCWVINGAFVMYLALLLFGAVPVACQLHLFLIFFSVALGPLGWAAILLSNGLVFHSVEKTASLTIHMTPVFVTWTIFIYNEQVQKDWPGRFPKQAELDNLAALDIYLPGLATYLAWLALHATWLLIDGVNCPARGMETVFNDLYVKMKLGAGFERMTGLKTVRSHAALYLLIHCVLVSFSFVWPVIIYKLGSTAHGAFGALIFTSAVWNGAGYYEYVMAKKYVKVLDVLKEGKEAQRKAPARN